MSNFNASMDYRGINISGQGQHFVLPDPFDEINVKTLNIVDDNNNVYYTMPREIPDHGGSVAVFETDGTSSLKPYAPYPANPSCFGWFDSGSGVIAPSTFSPTIIIPSFLTTGGSPQYNSPISTSFIFNQPSGIITCLEAGVYLIQQSYDVSSAPGNAIATWGIGLFNRTSGRYYRGGARLQTPNDPMPDGRETYNQTTYDTFTAGTQLNIYGTNADTVNSVNFVSMFLTIFRLA